MRNDGLLQHRQLGPGANGGRPDEAALPQHEPSVASIRAAFDQRLDIDAGARALTHDDELDLFYFQPSIELDAGEGGLFPGEALREHVSHGVPGRNQAVAFPSVARALANREYPLIAGAKRVID